MISSAIYLYLVCYIAIWLYIYTTPAVSLMFIVDYIFILSTITMLDNTPTLHHLNVCLRTLNPHSSLIHTN